MGTPGAAIITSVLVGVVAERFDRATCKWLVNTESEYLVLPCVFVRVVRPSVSGG